MKLPPAHADETLEPSLDGDKQTRKAKRGRGKRAGFFCPQDEEEAFNRVSVKK